MIRTGALLAILALQAQDPVATEAKFKAILDRCEKNGLSVPELPDGVRELEALIFPALPNDLRHRFDTVRAQSAILASVHALLLANKGNPYELPLPTGKPVSVRIVDVFKRTVKISKGEVAQEYAFSDLDSEWMVGAARADLLKRPDAPLLCGLWLAKAAKWDAAFVHLGDVATDHPLALEARKRGIEAALPALDALVKGKRWVEALTRLEALDRLAPAEARLATARGKLLDAMVETGKELCRKKSKGPMQEVIDLIAKHFPDGADRIEDIREAGRWIKVTDPKKFGIASVKGPPWLLQPKEGDRAATAYMAESAEKYDGFACVVRVPKGEKAAAGVVFDDRRRIVGLSARDEGGDTGIGVYEGNKGELLPNVFWLKVEREVKHHVSVRFRAGSYVVQYNGAVIHRSEGKPGGFESIALNADGGKAWFDEIWLLKRE